MQMKKYIIPLFLVFVFVFCLQLTNADTYQQYKSFNFNRACIYNGTYCDSGFICNITIQTPDTNTIINNQMMQRNGSFYNYTISAQPMMGFYPTIMTCINANGLAGADTTPIEITADGNPYRNFPIVYGIVILGLLFLIFHVSLRKQYTTNLFKTFGAILIIVGGVIMLYPGFNYTNFSTLDGLTFGLVLIGIGGFILTMNAEGLFE